jgi:hypothetical protein
LQSIKIEQNKINNYGDLLKEEKKKKVYLQHLNNVEIFVQD